MSCGRAEYFSTTRSTETLCLAWATITVAENILGLLPRGTHDPELFIKPKELVRELMNAGLVAGPQTGLGPRGINRKGDFVFGPLPPQVCHLHGVRDKSARFRQARLIELGHKISEETVDRSGALLDAHSIVK